MSWDWELLEAVQKLEAGSRRSWSWKQFAIKLKAGIARLRSWS